MYEFDVFLSYRRTKQWPDFVKNLFLPRFDHWLSAELGEDPRIYFDADDMETGVAWPQRLANSVASSKVMVCLWSRGYFASDWCKAELSHMLARRKEISPPHELLPLILAVVIQDKIDVPSELVDIQQFPLHDCADPWIGEGGRKAELLSDRIRKLAVHVHMAGRDHPMPLPGAPRSQQCHPDGLGIVAAPGHAPRRQQHVAAPALPTRHPPRLPSVATRHDRRAAQPPDLPLTVKVTRRSR